MLSKESVLYEQEVGIWVKYPRKTPDLRGIGKTEKDEGGTF